MKAGRAPAPEPCAPVRVFLTSALVSLFPEAPSEVDVSARSVGELLDQLDARWPGMRDRLSESRPAVRRHINIFVDGARADLATPLVPGSQVYIFTAMSGG